jgi:hypothetical protein
MGSKQTNPENTTKNICESNQGRIVKARCVLSTQSVNPAPLSFVMCIHLVAVSRLFTKLFSIFFKKLYQ